MVSLPITARSLSKEQFGLLGFFEPMSTIWIAILKFGFQHSILRFYSSCCLGDPPESRNAFFATLLWAPQACSAAATIIVVAALCCLHHYIGVPHFGLLLALFIWSQLEASVSLCQTFLGAQRLSHLVAGFSAVMRWAATATAIIAVLFVAPTATALQWSRVVAMSAAGLFIFRAVRRRSTPSVDAFSRPLLGDAVRYGIPMSLTEISSVLHDQLDRLIIAWYLGYVDLGVYHLNYSVAQYVGVVMASSFNPAFAPFANHLYDRSGAAEYRKQVSRISRLLLYATAAVLAGVWVFAPDLVPLFVGRDKARPDLFIIVACTYALAPLAGLLTYGLSLCKRTDVLLGTLVASCTVNLGVNLFLIPRIGVMGAAYATAASFLTLWLSRLAYTPRHTIPLDQLRGLFQPGLVAFTACITTRHLLVPLSAPILRLGVGGLLFMTVFCVLTFLLDRPLADEVWHYAALRLSRRSAGRAAEPGEVHVS